MNDGDLLHLIRLWTPEKAAVARLAGALADGLNAAYAEYCESVAQAPALAKEKLLPLAATAVGRVLMQEALEGSKSNASSGSLSDGLTEHLRSLFWGDLLLAAADNRNELAEHLLRKFRHPRFSDAQLPSNLHIVQSTPKAQVGKVILLLANFLELLHQLLKNARQHTANKCHLFIESRRFRRRLP